MTTHHSHFRRIIVATELGDTSSVAVRYAQALAHNHSATLILLHVIDPLLYAFPEGLPASIEKNDAARQEFAALEEEARRQGIHTHSRLVSGIICDRILQSVDDNDASLLILGTRSQSPAGHLAVGTIVRQLIGRCPSPILTIPAESSPERFASWGWRNVLAATDFSSCALEALQTGHALATSNYTVLHVMPTHANSQIHVERIRFQAPFNESHTVPVEHLSVTGKAVDFITEFARQLHVDLLVLGAPPQQLPVQQLLTSTILQIIAQVSCPVLCVPLHPVKEHAADAPLQTVSV